MKKFTVSTKEAKIDDFKSLEGARDAIVEYLKIDNLEDGIEEEYFIHDESGNEYSVV